MTNGPATAALPEQFVAEVRDALLHLYEAPRLHTHPLCKLLDAPAAGRGHLLRRELLDGTEALRLDAGRGAGSRAARAYRILELRYLEGQGAADVAEQLGLSRAHYHREHHRALEAVALVLWDRWRASERWREGGSAASHADQLRREAVRLRADDAATIDPAEVLRGVVELLRPLCAERGVRLSLRLPVAAPIARGDRVALRQALLTVLGHVVRAIDAGGLDASLRAEAGQVVLAVGGAGKAPAADRLGLDEARPFVAALRGTLALVETGREWAVELALRPRERATLLVVDNNPDFIRLIERYLADTDWEAVGTPDAEQAYRLACERRPGVVLLDVVIPGRDGWDLLMQLKSTAETRDLPVIVCSVLNDPEIARSLGAAGYLHKPVSRAQLLEALAPLRRR
ncbi:MAG: response regulator [Chloroflexota bacterium]|nr:MAG: response regulator [Chloroflexota bacterium]